MRKDHPRRVKYPDPLTQGAAMRVVTFDITTGP
jgi:hypothetical protein